MKVNKMSMLVDVIHITIVVWRLTSVLAIFLGKIDSKYQNE
jgi:hypothetical protein